MDTRETRCRFIIHSRESLKVGTRDKSLPFEPVNNDRIVLEQNRVHRKVVLYVEQVTWMETSPDMIFLSCGVEVPCVGAHDGERAHILFGELPAGMCEEIVQGDDRWKEIEEGDNFFTLKVSTNNRFIRQSP